MFHYEWINSLGGDVKVRVKMEGRKAIIVDMEALYNYVTEPENVREEFDADAAGIEIAEEDAE